jgi:hypothetical protein
LNEAEHQRLLLTLREDRWLAHRHLFRHRHPEDSPEAHRELVEAIYRPVARLGVEGFRGFAKSTYLEEAAVLRGAFREFHNMVIVGSSYRRACDRLAAIKREFEINDYIIELFGRLQGDTWQEGKIVLANGACIQALGRDQSTVGIKHFDWRPDAALIDDVEDPEEVRTDAERQQTWDWFMKTFLPSLDHPLYSWIRVLGTRRGSGSLPERIEAAGWPRVQFPIESIGPAGERIATWPSKFPLATIDRMRQDYAGDMHTFNQEFMCQPMSAADITFRREMFRVEPRPRTWEAVYAMIDPARTVRTTSAVTGWAVWSWIRNRLIVWAADGPSLLPDEIVALAFDLNERFQPIWIGIEKDGLEQWLLQPMRAEQVRRGTMIPYRPIAATSGTRGGGQAAFIKGLQPFFAAGEISFAQPLPALEDQLLSFPVGKRDIANALAYAPAMRPGAPIYEGFRPDHIAEVAELERGISLYIAANATGALTTALAIQAEGGRVRILYDWVREGSPIDRVPEILAEAALLGDGRLVAERAKTRDWTEMLKGVAPERSVMRRMAAIWTVPPHHHDRHMNVGLVQAIRQLPAELRTGGEPIAGQGWLADAFGRSLRGAPVVEVSAAAHWTLRALAGGYTRAMTRGRLADAAEEGPYRTLMEGLEAFCGMLRQGVLDEEGEDAQPIAYNRAGMPYRSVMPPARTAR